MIRVDVDQLFLSNMGFVVLLREKGQKIALPIFIGAAEAQAIAFCINEVQVPRPLTHDLLKNFLDFQECRLQRIEVCDLKEGTFYARLVLEKDGEELELDSRPSDAIALALRCGAQIFVAEAVMKEAGREIGEGDGEKGKTLHHPDHKSGELTPLEALETKLGKAIEEERFEDAARLRDEIKRLKHPPGN